MKPIVKKVLRRASYVLAAVVAVVAVLAIYVQVDGIPRYPQTAPVVTVTSSPQRIERGRKLAGLICNDCHENNETHQLTGRHMTDLPPEFGEIYSKNITSIPTSASAAGRTASSNSSCAPGCAPTGSTFRRGW